MKKCRITVMRITRCEDLSAQDENPIFQRLRDAGRTDVYRQRPEKKRMTFAGVLYVPPLFALLLRRGVKSFFCAGRTRGGNSASCAFFAAALGRPACPSMRRRRSHNGDCAESKDPRTQKKTCERETHATGKESFPRRAFLHVPMCAANAFSVHHASQSIRSILKMTGRVPSEQQAIMVFSSFIQSRMIEPP